MLYTEIYRPGLIHIKQSNRKESSNYGCGKDMKERGRKLAGKLAAKQVNGIGVIEIILILVIIIGLVLIFRNQIEAILQSAFDSINANSSEINSEIKIN